MLLFAPLIKINKTQPKDRKINISSYPAVESDFLYRRKSYHFYSFIFLIKISLKFLMNIKFLNTVSQFCRKTRGQRQGFLRSK